MADQTVKGLLLTMFIKHMEKRYSKEEMDLLAKKYGDLNFSAFKDYTIEDECRLYDCAVEVFYPKNKIQGYREFGRMGFNLYADSVVGKTFFTLFHMDLKEAALKANTILSQISRNLNLKVEDAGENAIKITVIDLPYPFEYYTGVWEAAMEHFKKKGRVLSKRISDRVFEYTLEWESETN